MPTTKRKISSRKNTRQAQTTGTKNKRGESTEIVRGTIRTSSGDPLEVQMSIKVRKPKGRRLSKKVIEQAILYKLNDKKLRDPRGFKLKIINWTNPDRDPSKTNPRNNLPLDFPRDYGTQAERWETLRVPLLSARMAIQKVRAGRGKRQ